MYYCKKRDVSYMFLYSERSFKQNKGQVSGVTTFSSFCNSTSREKNFNLCYSESDPLETLAIGDPCIKIIRTLSSFFPYDLCIFFICQHSSNASRCY